MKLIEPTLELKTEFLAMAQEFTTNGETHVHGIGSIDIDDFDASVRRSKDHAQGIALPEGWVPCSTYWLLCHSRIVGTSNLRYELNDFLREFGGHIGYAIRPSQRQQGYGTQMLSLVLAQAQTLAIKRVLITCNDDNIASARVIEKNSGKLTDKVLKDDSKIPLRRYWIDLAIQRLDL